MWLFSYLLRHKQHFLIPDLCLASILRAQALLLSTRQRGNVPPHWFSAKGQAQLYHHQLANLGSSGRAEQQQTSARGCVGKRGAKNPPKALFTHPPSNSAVRRAPTTSRCCPKLDSAADPTQTAFPPNLVPHYTLWHCAQHPHRALRPTAISCISRACLPKTPCFSVLWAAEQTHTHPTCPASTCSSGQ